MSLCIQLCWIENFQPCETFDRARVRLSFALRICVKRLAEVRSKSDAEEMAVFVSGSKSHNCQKNLETHHKVVRLKQWLNQ